MLAHPIRRRDVLRPSLQFRSSVTGRFVTRLFAFLNPRETYSVRKLTPAAMIRLHKRDPKP